MNDEWLDYLDELAETAAEEIIRSEGIEPEYLTYSETAADIVETEDLDDEDEEYLIKEIERLVTTAEFSIYLIKNERRYHG